jgi:hypothetical protein
MAHFGGEFDCCACVHDCARGDVHALSQCIDDCGGYQRCSSVTPGCVGPPPQPIPNCPNTKNYQDCDCCTGEGKGCDVIWEGNPPGPNHENTTYDQCKELCDQDSTCSGFVFGSSNITIPNNCYFTTDNNLKNMRTSCDRFYYKK